MTNSKLSSLATLISTRPFFVVCISLIFHLEFYDAQKILNNKSWIKIETFQFKIINQNSFSQNYAKNLHPTCKFSHPTCKFSFNLLNSHKIFVWVIDFDICKSFTKNATLTPMTVTNFFIRVQIARDWIVILTVIERESQKGEKNLTESERVLFYIRWTLSFSHTFKVVLFAELTSIHLSFKLKNKRDNTRSSV